MRLKTKNYHIERFNPRDYKSFFQLLENNKPRLQDFFTGTMSKTKTLADTKTYAKEIAQRMKAKSYMPFIISDTKTKQFIGLVDVKNIDWNKYMAELGYFIDVNYEGKGIITEAVGNVINYIVVEHQFKSLYCRIGSENSGSQKVATKNGFQCVETRKNDYQISDGSFVDLDYFIRSF